MTTTTPAGAPLATAARRVIEWLDSTRAVPSPSIQYDIRDLAKAAIKAMAHATRPAPDLSGLEELMERLRESHCDTVECDHGFLLHRDRCPNPTCLGQDLRDAVSLLSALKAAGEERDAIKAGLSDPNFVHINMLGGGIAKPSLRQMLHLEGEAALATWDKATSLQQENDRLREAIRMALQCTPHVSPDGRRIVYDCGDPWELLRAALSLQGGDAG